MNHVSPKLVTLVQSGALFLPFRVLLEPRMSASPTNMSRLDPKNRRTNEEFAVMLKRKLSHPPLATTMFVLLVCENRGCMW